MLSVLLVDDEPTLRLALGDAMERAGYAVRSASDGEEAWALISNQPFDVLVTDVAMPKLDGMTLLRRVRNIRPDTRVIVMTAHARVPDVVTAFKQGAEDYIKKPFDTHELLDRLRKITAQATKQ